MKNNQETNSKKDFQKHLDSLHEVYEKSTLKERHRLNEHIKHLIKTYGEIEIQEIKKDLENETTNKR